MWSSYKQHACKRLIPWLDFVSLLSDCDKWIPMEFHIIDIEWSAKRFLDQECVYFHKTCQSLECAFPQSYYPNVINKMHFFIAGKKKSRFQTFKNFFAKKKRKEAAGPVAESEVQLKSSQSIEDTNTQEPTSIHTDRESDTR